jgi:DNA polymerase I
MDNRLYLLDAFALIFRAYYALAKNPRVTSSGKNTNAQFGFTTTLLDLLNKEKPTHIAVCFDSAGPTERHTDFEFYKANRQEAPEDLIAAVPDIKKILDGFKIPYIEVPGYEADDIVGTLAKQAATQDYEVYMVTPDKDYGQLVQDNIFIWKPPAFGNPAQVMGPKEVCEKWDIERVDQVIDLLGLMGDASDNIPGIKGVGEKTAVQLLKQYSTLENVLENAHLLKGKMAEKVANGKADAIMSKKLATIILDVPTTFDEKACIMEKPDVEVLTEIFNELEFRTLGKRILGDTFSVNTTKASPANNNTQQTSLFGDSTPENSELTNLKTITDVTHHYLTADTNETIQQLITELQQANLICIDTETTGLDANNVDIVGLSFSTKPGTGWYVPLPINFEQAKEKINLFAPVFNDATKQWVGHNLKYDLLVLKWYDVNLKGVCLHII